MDDIAARLAGVDIMLVDQILRHRIPPGAKILDAGCGGGRNLGIFRDAGHEVWGLDQSEDAVTAVRQQFPELDATTRADRFRCEALESTTFPAASFDYLICNAVLHFARDGEHFRSMVASLKRLLRPGGTVFVRLASREGVRDLLEPLPGRPRGWGRFPDGSEHFLIDDTLLSALEDDLGLVRLEPLKTVSVGGYRAMATWIFGASFAG